MNACVDGLWYCWDDLRRLAQGAIFTLEDDLCWRERRFQLRNMGQGRPRARCHQFACGNTITVRQCDLKRTVTVNEQSQSMSSPTNARGEAAIKAAALMGGAPAAPAGQTITLSLPSPTPGSASNCSATRRGT